MSGDASKQELIYLAHLMARPEFLNAALIDPKKLSNATARAMLNILVTQGPAFARPGPMSTALAELPEEFDSSDVSYALVNIPDPEEVELDGVIALKNALERTFDDRVLALRLNTASRLLAEGSKSADEIVAELRWALDSRAREHIGRDHTATGIRQRLSESSRHIRWRCGADDLDYAFKGIGPDGQPGEGALAQGEIVLLAARYGSGKTRIALNWVAALLDQGASVALLALEDDDTSFAARLMGIKFDIAPWKILRYAAGGVAYLSEQGRQDAQKCEEALSWWESIGNKFRVYDGSAKANIFKFKEAVELLRQDAVLYGTTHTVIDYVSAFTGETHQLEQYAFELRGFASRHNVCLIELAQVANDTIKFGSAPGMVASKGSGAWGAACHIGIEILDDPALGQKEIGLLVKKARAAARTSVYATINEETGKVTAWYGTPVHLGLEATTDKPKRGGRK